MCAQQRPLQEPIVSCDLGKLYNKDALIEFLLDRSAFGDGDEICGHIRSLKVRSGAFPHGAILKADRKITFAAGRQNTHTHTKHYAKI